MFNRALFATLLLFWGAMTWLLWRAEFGDPDTGSRLPLETVWNKLLTAPDDSSLEIRQRGRKIGVVRVTANVNEAFATGRASTVEELELQAEGRVNRIQNYTLDVDGQLAPTVGEKPYRFALHLDVATNNTWQNLSARVTQRPNEWALETSATNQTVTLRLVNDGETWEEKFTFAELQQPEKIMARLGVPFAGPMLAGVFGIANPDPQKLPLALQWDARQDWFKLGATQVRAYRLTAKLFEKFQIVIYLSRVGEILRVELPEGITALHETFVNLSLQ